MKKKAFLIAASLFALTLSSCGSSSYYGTYQFQMGKQNAAHIGIYMDLSKDKIEIEYEGEKKNMEKFNLKFSPPEGEGVDIGGEGLIGGVLTYFKDGLLGGYKIEYSEELEQDHLTLLPKIDISDLIAAINKDEEGSSSSSESTSSEDDQLFIPSEFIDDLLIATHKGDTINVTVPVSLTNLMYQLYWYGFDIFDPENTTLEQHKHGTHPTAAEVDKINETYNTGAIPHYDLDVLVNYQTFRQVKYRDFNQMTMTLAKAKL